MSIIVGMWNGSDSSELLLCRLITGQGISSKHNCVRSRNHNLMIIGPNYDLWLLIITLDRNLLEHNNDPQIVLCIHFSAVQQSHCRDLKKFVS